MPPRNLLYESSIMSNCGRKRVSAKETMCASEAFWPKGASKENMKRKELQRESQSTAYEYCVDIPGKRQGHSGAAEGERIRRVKAIEKGMIRNKTAWIFPWDTQHEPAQTEREKQQHSSSAKTALAQATSSA